MRPHGGAICDMYIFCYSKNMEKKSRSLVEDITSWVGSPTSLVLHTLVFGLSFGAGIFHFIGWGMMLLILTTAVSLEAIYLAIFIQMTVNKHTESLREVEEDVEEIQENIDEIQEDVEEISEEEEKDLARKKHQVVTLETLAQDMQRILSELNSLKQK